MESGIDCCPMDMDCYVPEDCYNVIISLWRSHDLLWIAFTGNKRFRFSGDNISEMYKANLLIQFFCFQRESLDFYVLLMSDN